MKIGLTLVVAVAVIGGAQGARVLAKAEHAGQVIDEPYAPSPGAAPFVSLGYREAVADLLLARVMPYFGGSENTAEGMCGLCEALVATDPSFHEVYEWCARAMTLARYGVDQRTFLRAIALLENGAREFPDSWRIPYSAGQMYMIDLKTDAPAQRRIWDERGSLLIEAAIRKPGAPAESATTAATLRSRLGQHQRAVDGLREMLLITNDKAARKRILDKLAELQKGNAEDIAAEILLARKRFDETWKRERPSISPTMYILIGPKLSPGFDMADLATGGRDLVGEELTEQLERVTDPTPSKPQ